MGEDEGQGRMQAGKLGEEDEHPLPTTPQSINPGPLTRPHMREVEMISEAEKS